MQGLSRLALEALPSGVVVVDGGGTIVLVNRQIEQQFGYAAHELIGQTMDVLVPDSLRMAHGADRLAFMPGADSAAHGRCVATCSGSAGTVPGFRWKSV